MLDCPLEFTDHKVAAERHHEERKHDREQQLDSRYRQVVCQSKSVADKNEENANNEGEKQQCLQLASAEQLAQLLRSEVIHLRNHTVAPLLSSAR